MASCCQTFVFTLCKVRSASDCSCCESAMSLKPTTGSYGMFCFLEAVLTIFCKVVELCSILLFGFSLLLVVAVESCTLVNDVLL